MPIIDTDYFRGEITLPTSTPEQQSAINELMEPFEDDALNKMLGYDLKSEYLLNPTSQRFLDLRDGAEFTFTFQGRVVTRKWIGFKNDKNISVLAYHSYFYIQRDRTTHTGNLGETKTREESSDSASSWSKSISAWNKYIALKGEANDWYNSFELSSYEHIDDKPSLFNFLLANKETYPEWVFESEEEQNYWAI